MKHIYKLRIKINNKQTNYVEDAEEVIVSNQNSD